MFYAGLHLFNEDKGISYLICHVNHEHTLFAVADMAIALNAINPPKPKIFSKSELLHIVNKQKLIKKQFAFPAEMTFSDEALIKINRACWLTKRDKKWGKIQSLCSETMLQKYLYGDGINQTVELLIQTGEGWSSRGAYYNALNRYITFGCTKNSLLPVKLKNVGSNYLHFEKPGDGLIKRGRGKNDNSKSRSKTRGITNRDKQNILKTVRKMTGKFTVTRAFETYQDTYERIELHRQIGEEGAVHLHPLPEEQCISFQQFQYHLRKMVSPEKILKKRVGQLRYDKDFKPKQGSSLDGVQGATYRYEVDATVLDLYVRYPFDKTQRLTMGRPVLYIVVDVYSTMIVGFYVGFDGPNWQGAAQALVNACSDKVEFAANFGETISEMDWPAKHVPMQLTIDNGTEYPNSLIANVLKSELGVKAFNFTAIYRGDAKGTVEGTFNVLNNSLIHHLPGSIFKELDRGEQHPSNRSLYTYEDLVAKLIHQVIYHNQSAERLKRFSWQAVYDDIQPTPQALFLHSLETDMEGGRPTTEVDRASILWGFLPEEEATVQKNGLSFRGVMYASEEAAKRGFFSTAAHSGRFKIIIKRTRQNCEQLWHKTDAGEFIRFDLKNVNNSSPFAGIQWEMADHLVEFFKQKGYEARELRKHVKAKRDTEHARITRNTEKDLKGAVSSTRKSIQPGIKARKRHQQSITQRLEQEAFQESLRAMESDYEEVRDQGLIDFDDELFG